MKILGIESSCDETSAALLDGGGGRGRVLCAHTHTQEEHARYGGVVPEIASRAHFEKIDVLVRRSLDECGLALSDIDLVAVTDSPGLAGALLVGVSFALGVHVSCKVPITGVNHLEGHIASLFIEHPDLQPPFLVLLASGGHTAIYNYKAHGECVLLGETVDDAAGEAFDKVGKLLGFKYPAGREIELYAEKSIGGRVPDFPVSNISLSREFCFSFSGLKTAVRNFVLSKDENYINEHRADICAAFQNTVVKTLVDNLANASLSCDIKKVALTGGVACNGYLRREVVKRFGAENVFFPSPQLCTDNGAMIAQAGYMMYQTGRVRFPKMRAGRGM